MPHTRNDKINGKSNYNIQDTTFGNRYFIVAVSAILISVSMYWLSNRLEQEADNAERAQFGFRLSELRSAVLLMQASLVAKDELSTANIHEGSNPMDWFKGNTSHYLGEMSLTEAKDKQGNWVYDPEEKVIAYLPNWNKKQDGQAKWLRYKVVVVHEGLALKGL